MERELNRKEKEKDGQVRVLLENMTPRISYTAPIRKTNLGIRVNSARVREKYESMEARDQYRREQQMAKVIYQRESEIPKSPLETHSKSNTSPKDIVTIPFFKPGSYPPKVIRITEPTNLITEDFMKVFRPDLRQPPPPPPPLMNMYGQVMSHQVPPPMPGPVPSMYTGQSIPQAPPRVGPLPSAPIPAYNTMMPGMPMYDPNMMVNPMDPYNFMNKGKILYNPEGFTRQTVAKEEITVTSFTIFNTKAEQFPTSKPGKTTTCKRVCKCTDTQQCQAITRHQVRKVMMDVVN
jgi:hypothetical protein